MMRAGRVQAVVAFEFMSTVKRKSYLIVTFGLPFFFLLYGAMAGLLGNMAGDQIAGTRLYGVVDASGLLGLAPEDDPKKRRGIRFRAYASEEQARRDVLEQTIDGYYALPADFVKSGRVDVYFAEALVISRPGASAALDALVIDALIEGRLDEQAAARVRRPVGNSQEWMIDRDGGIAKRSLAEQLAAFALPLAFVVLWMVSLLLTTGLLVTAISVEKENRVVEVLLASATADEILAGKLLGLGAAGLLQVAVWFSMTIGGSLVAVVALELLGVEVPWPAIGISVVFFVIAYLFIGSLMIGMGSLGRTQREAQQLGVFWTLPTMVPVFAIVPLMAAPHGTLARTLTFIPFTTPVTIVIRAFVDGEGLPAWEVALALFVLSLSTWLAIALAARLFRIGLLLTGSRPTLRQLWRQAGFGREG